MTGPRDPRRWKPPPDARTGPGKAPTPTTGVVANMDEAIIASRVSLTNELWAHDPATCRTCVLWWVPIWDPALERVDPWLNRIDYCGFYGEAA